MRDMKSIPIGAPINPRIMDPYWESLAPLTKRIDDTSQFGESTLVAAILDRIGERMPWCFECGASEPEYASNTKLFRERQWQSVLIEKDPLKAQLLRSRAGPWAIIIEQEVVIENCTPERRITGLDAVLAEVRCPWCRSRFPYHADFGVIDVDGQDWHLWKRMTVYSPRIMVVECWPGDDAAPPPELGGKGQAGENAIVELGREKGYKPICRTTCNVIFIDGNGKT